MYRYIFNATGKTGACPFCGEKSILVSMKEEQETRHPMLPFIAWTEQDCASFPIACRPCLDKRRRTNSFVA